MHAGEPDLADALAVARRQIGAQPRRRLGKLRRRAARIMVDVEQPVGLVGPAVNDGPGAHIALVPDHRPERVTLLLQCERMAGPMDLGAHEPVGHRERPDPVVDRPDHFLDRSAIGIDRVPDADEVHALHLDRRRLGQQTAPAAELPDAPVSNAAQIESDLAEIFQDAAVVALAVAAIGIAGEARQIGLVVVVVDKPLPRDHRRHDADGEGAAAEAEAVDAIAGTVVAAAEAVERDHVALQAEAEDAAKRREQLERRRTDAVIIECNLPARITQVQELEQPPDIGLEHSLGAVAGPIRQQHDISRRSVGHEAPRPECRVELGPQLQEKQDTIIERRATPS